MTDPAHRGAKAPEYGQPQDRTALLINPHGQLLRFPGADVLEPKARDAAHAIALMKKRTRRGGYRSST